MVRNRVKIGMLGQGVVKRGIKNGDLRHLASEQIRARREFP